MPKSISTFIKSKMNKDSDSRILPSGEYRDAQNVSISKSEGADVGALENVLGNRALVNINSLLSPGVKNLEVIGHLMDIENDRIFMLLTNYNDTSSDMLSNFAPTNSNHYIYCYDITTETTTQMVTGNFLNFSKTHPIYGINLIEELLFWTDDRNQPRKINVQSALAAPATSSNPYYTTEDQISVAKYYPYNPIRLYKKLGPFLALANGTVSRTVPMNLQSNGKIQIGDIVTTNGATLTAPNAVVDVSGSAAQAVSIDPGFAYSIGDEITFYRTSMRDVVSENLPHNIGVTATSPNPFYDPDWPGDPELLTEKFVRFSYRYKFDDGEYSLIAPFTQSAFIPKQDGYFMASHNGELEDFDEVKTYVSTIVNFMENKVNNIEFHIDTPVPPAELYNDYKIKEIQLLYKESDSTNIRVLDSIPYTDTLIADARGTYSLVLTNDGAPSSYCCTGVVVTTTSSGSGIGMTLELTTDGSAGAGAGILLSATIVDFGTGYADGDLIYPAGGSGVAYFTLSIVDPNVFTYDYQSRKPINTLPADQTTRVSDIVPVKAFAQEVAGNRVIYANYLNKHTSPSTLDYEVKVSDRLLAYETNTNFSTVQYPNHTLKQNRNYQLGVVLSDRYGRQSDVILSDVKVALTSGYGGSTTFGDYRTAAENASKNVLNWFGDSLQIVFNSEIPSTIATPGYPGLYSATNPTGWYSYKIVVKQQEQEYYNVYLPGILTAYPSNNNERAYTAFSSLYSDNVNKIPKDLQDVGPEQTQFRGSEKTWGRLENFIWKNGTTYLNQTRQYYPSLLPDKSIQVGTMTELDLGVLKMIRAQNVTAVTNDFLLSSYDSRIKIGMSVDSDQITTDLINTATTLAIVYPGSGYPASTTTAGITTSAAANSGASGKTLTITCDADGALTSVSGTGGVIAGTYVLGDVIELTSGGGTGALVAVVRPTVTDYTEYTDAAATAAKAKMTISDSTTGNVPADEIFKINEKGERLFYNHEDNPYISKFKTQNSIGLLNSVQTPRLAVYETEPVFSNLDIYWETSTSGLISELNTAVSDGDTTSPFALRLATGISDPVTFDFKEDDTVSTFITPNFKAVANPAVPAFITSNVNMVLANVLNGNNNVTNQFKLVPQGSGGYRIQTQDTFVVGNSANLRFYTFNIEVDLTTGSNRNVFPFSLTTELGNIGPTITPVAPAVCGGTLAGSISSVIDTKIATFDAVNGSASTTLRTQDLSWSLRNDDLTLYTDNDFELRQPTIPQDGRIELWVLAGRRDGTYIKRVKVMDGGGASTNCQLQWTIAN